MFVAVYTVYRFVVSKFADLLTESANYSWCHFLVITNILDTPGAGRASIRRAHFLACKFPLQFLSQNLQNNHECSLCKQGQRVSKTVQPTPSHVCKMDKFGLVWLPSARMQVQEDALGAARVCCTPNQQL
jgi:hypothetical protein